MASDNSAAAQAWLEQSVSSVLPIPSEVLRGQLQQLFAALDGMSRLMALFHNLDSSAQSQEFFEWLLEFCTEQLQPSLWADRRVVVSLLRSGLHEDGLDTVEYLGRAARAEPTLGNDTEVFELALEISISSVSIFSENFLILDESRKMLIQACRGVRLPGENQWSGRSWPMDTFPCGLLGCLPATYLERDFLIEAASHVNDAGASYRSLPEALKEDRDVAIAFAEKQQGILICLPTQLFQDREVLRKGLNAEPHAIEALPPDLWRDDELVEIAALGWGASFFATDIGKLHAHRGDLVLKLAALNFSTLFFTPRSFGSDAEVVEAALTSPYAHWAGAKETWAARNAWNLLRLVWGGIVADVLKSDKNFVKKLLFSNGSLFGLCDTHQRADQALLFAAVSSDATALRDVDGSFWWPHKRRRVDPDGDAMRSHSVGSDDMARKLLSVNLECWSHLPADVKQQLKLDAFECCVCYQLPREEIRQCFEGHLICRECVNRILREAAFVMPRCPVCRSYVWTNDDIFSYGARNRFAERELQERIAVRA
jgi:hypothetical protein